MFEIVMGIDHFLIQLVKYCIKDKFILFVESNRLLRRSLIQKI